MPENQQQIETLSNSQARAILTRAIAAQALGVAPSDSAEMVTDAMSRTGQTSESMARMADRLKTLRSHAQQKLEVEARQRSYEAAEQRYREVDVIGTAMRERDEAKRQLFIANDNLREMQDGLVGLVKEAPLDLQELRAFVNTIEASIRSPR